jgi:hypothetical protein
MTGGYNLPAAHVLHTVGPIVGGAAPTRRDRELLASCYTSCLDLARERGLGSVAFCCISTGEFGYPNREAAQVAVAAVRDWKKQTNNQMRVIFDVFKPVDHDIYRGASRSAWIGSQTRSARRTPCLVGAGAGLSTAAGFAYAGPRFDENFADFRDAYGITDMYAGGFYPFPDEETYWAWWSR